MSSFLRTLAGGLPHASVPVALIAAFLTAGLVLKIVFIGTPHGSDDINYYRFSEQLITSFSLDTHHHHAGRLAFLVMSGFPAVLMGDLYFGALANVIYCLVTELLVVIFVFRNLGPAPAAIAALFLSMSGISLVYSGGLSPEPVLALFVTIACLCLHRTVNSTGRNPWQWVGLAGMAAGLAYSAKDTGILIVPPAVLSLILLPWPPADLQSRIGRSCVFLAGFAFVWILESTLYWAITGDFFYKVQAVASSHNPSPPAQDLGLLMFLRRGYWKLYDTLAFWDLLLIPGLLAVVAWAAMLYRREAWAVFALVGMFCGVYLYFGTSSLSRLVNLPSQPRYTYFLFPLAAIGISYLLRTCRQTVGRALIVGMVAISGAISVSGATQRVGHLYFQPLLRNAVIAIELLPQMGPNHVFVDIRYHQSLRHYLDDETWQNLRGIPLEGPLPVGYYLVFDEHLSERYRDKSERRRRYEEVAQLPVVLRVAFPHSFASRYFRATDPPRYAAIVHEKR